MPHRNIELRRLWAARYRVKNYERKRAYMKAYAKKHAKRLRAFAIAYGMAYRATCRAIVIEAYGGGCACCGFKNPLGLLIDHVNGGGSIDRRGDLRGNAWVRTIKLGFPSRLQVYCAICNMAKHSKSTCPIKQGEHR